jgi:hypothetical protein
MNSAPDAAKGPVRPTLWEDSARKRKSTDPTGLVA